VGAREIDGDRGKEIGLDALEEEKGEEQGFGDAQHGENEERRDLVAVQNEENEGGQGLFEAQLVRNEENDVSQEQGFGDAQHGENEERRDLVDVQRGENEGGQGLFEAQLGRNEENDVSQEEDVQVVEKRAKGRLRGRGAKEKKNNVVSPFVGRITRSRAKQCQVLLSPKKDIGKRKSAVRPKQPRGTRRNARGKGAGRLEVSEEPKDVIELLSVASVTEPQVGGKSSPLLNAFGIEDQLPELPMKTKSQIQNKSSPVVAESQVEAKLPPPMKQLQSEDHSSPGMNHLQIEDNARRDDIGCTEGTTKNSSSEVTYASMEPGCGGSEDIDHKNAQQEDTSENVERCTGGEQFQRMIVEEVLTVVMLNS
jgi:hypothetical protein